MKRIITILSLLLASSTVFANCPKPDQLRKQAAAIEEKSKNFFTVADYLKTRFTEANGEYERDHSILMLMVETQLKATKMMSQAGELHIQASQELRKCLAK